MNKRFHAPKLQLSVKNYCFSPSLPSMLGTVLLLSLFVSLGFWQLARAKEKEILQQNYTARTHQKPLSITQLPTDTNLRYYAISMKGSYDNTHTILLDNKIHNHQLGYEVLTLFLPTHNARGVFVNRGWVPADQNRDTFPLIPHIEGEKSVEGNIYITPGTPFTLGHNIEHGDKWPLRVESLDIAGFQKALKQPLYPFIVRLSPHAPNGFLRDWEPINMSPYKHLGYAFQWFTFALVLFIIFVVLNTKKSSL